MAKQWLSALRLTSVVRQRPRLWCAATVSLLVLGASLILSTGNQASIPDEYGPSWLEALGEFKLTADDGSPGEYFGHAVSVHADTAIVGAHWDDVLGAGSGSACVFVRDGAAWGQQAKLTASDGAAGDAFGNTVSLSGDTAVVSAHGDDDLGDSSGAAYVFVRDGTLWSQQGKLMPSDGSALDAFGVAAIDGDTIIVGSHNDDDKGDSSGSAYVFVREGTTWTQQAKLTASDGAVGDHFGWSVAIDGDRVVIGALDDDDDGDSSGSAYVFARSGSTWSQRVKLTASDGAAGDEFGRSVTMSGDTIAIGAPYDDDSGNGTGAAYIFAWNGASWDEQAKLLPEDAAAGDIFAYTVAVDGDLAVCGAYGDDESGEGSGSAYVFLAGTTGWSQYEKLAANDGAAGDHFGLATAVSGSVVIAGAPYDDAATGSAYVYEIPSQLCPLPLEAVEVIGPDMGSTNVPYAFAAVISPPSATQPITYTWLPEPASGQGSVSAAYEWTVPGTFSVTLEAENCGGELSGTRSIIIYGPCEVPLEAMEVIGPDTGYTNIPYAFAGVISPLNATEPITYTWSPEPASGQGSVSAAYEWAGPGFFSVTLEAENCGAAVTGTHGILIYQSCDVPLEAVELAGPDAGYTNTPYTFTAVISPPNATRPMTYTWSPEPMSGQGSDTARYEWPEAGSYMVSLAADSCGVTVADTHGIVITARHRVYLPLVVRNHAACIAAGELIFWYKDDHCCSGSSEISLSGPCDTPGVGGCDVNGCYPPPPCACNVCAPCGDGVCQLEYRENRCNCPSDCS